MDEYDEFESMCETEMEMARELEMDFTEKTAPVSVINTPSMPTVKRNLFSLEDAENSSLTANTNNSQNPCLTFKAPSSQVLTSKSNKKSRVEDSLNNYLDELLLNSPRRKKQKLERDGDANIIKKILSYRQESEKSKPDIRVHLKKPPKQGSSSWSRNDIHRHLPDGDFVSVTTGDGKRFYLDLITEEKFNIMATDFTILKSNTTLLEEPYRLLKLKAENELLQMKQNEKKYTLQQVTVNPQQNNESSKEILWVEKYRPKNYLDLLSDEGTNKTVLRWLKLWDKVVFGNDFLANKNENQKNKDKKTTFFNKSAPDVIEKLDENSIPEQKVILLCGPPGLGKTTLAHVIARHAGYNVLELNASDDRSTEAFKRTIEDATSMKAVMGKQKRPNCLVIDEIDGAPTASISLLVNLLQGKKGKEQKAKKQAKILKRPIICICNDLYTTSLRALRQMALVVKFLPTQSARLIERLHSISSKQNLEADLSVLRTLCNRTENDIRSCLSVLQFIKASSGRLRLSDLEGAAVGQKDYQRSLFTGWQEIFTIPPTKKKVFRNVHQEDDGQHKSDEKSVSRFSRIHRLISSCGEFDKLTQGWFENYPNTKFKHTHLEPVVQSLEWTTTSDIIQVEIHHSQSWILMKYLPYAFVAYHFLFATHQRPKLMFPMQFGEHIGKLTKCQSVIAAMASEMMPVTRFFSNSSTLVYDLIPYIMVIIQPHMRPVNIHLYSQSEKETFGKLVDAMISYNLTYQQDRSLDGQYSFTLDPDIEDVAYYSGISRGKPLSYSCRQLVAREIEMEKVRRTENYFRSGSKEKSNRQESTTMKKPPPTKPAIPLIQTKKLPDIKPVLKEAQVPRDFFGRKIVMPANETNTHCVKSILSGDVWFKFKEGYSNAVRRPIKIRDFLS